MNPELQLKYELIKDMQAEEQRVLEAGLVVIDVLHGKLEEEITRAPSQGLPRSFR